MEQKLLQSFRSLADSVAAVAPKVAVGILLVIAGFIAAKLTEIVLRYMLTRVRFDTLMEKAGVDRALQRIGLRQKLNISFRGWCIFSFCYAGQNWRRRFRIDRHLERHRSVFFVFAEYRRGAAAGDSRDVAGAIRRRDGYAIGAQFRNRFRAVARKAGFRVFVVSMMAVAQLGIDTEIVRIVTSFILGGAALAFRISFGFGTRDVIRNITAGFYVRKFLHIGNRLEVSGQRNVPGRGRAKRGSSGIT